MKVMISAGEISGDLHGAGLVHELKSLVPSVEVFGIGGPRMQAEGVECLYTVDQMSLIGFSEVLRHIPFIQQVLRHMRQLLKERRPDLLVLIDYPGFNLRLAQMAKTFGVKVLYYITPQVWAWGRGRLRKIARYVDKAAVILDFEEEIYRRAGVDVDFVGHPILDRMITHWNREEFFRHYGLNPSHRLLGLLPGSRTREVQRFLPEMLRTASLLREQIPQLQVAISKADFLEDALYGQVVGPGEWVLVRETYELMRHSDFLIVASGTATLEATYFGTPFVIVYRVSPLSWLLGRWLVKVDTVGLVNVIAGRKIVPEFLQGEFQAEKMVPYIREFLVNGRRRREFLDALREVRARLGTPGAARRTARMALDLIQS